MSVTRKDHKKKSIFSGVFNKKKEKKVKTEAPDTNGNEPSKEDVKKIKSINLSDSAYQNFVKMLLIYRDAKTDAEKEAILNHNLFRQVLLSILPAFFIWDTSKSQMTLTPILVEELITAGIMAGDLENVKAIFKNTPIQQALVHETRKLYYTQEEIVDLCKAIVSARTNLNVTDKVKINATREKLKLSLRFDKKQRIDTSELPSQAIDDSEDFTGIDDKDHEPIAQDSPLVLRLQTVLKRSDSSNSESSESSPKVAHLPPSDAPPGLSELPPTRLALAAALFTPPPTDIPPLVSPSFVTVPVTLPTPDNNIAKNQLTRPAVMPDLNAIQQKQKELAEARRQREEDAVLKAAEAEVSRRQAADIVVPFTGIVEVIEETVALESPIDDQKKAKKAAKEAEKKAKAAEKEIKKARKTAIADKNYRLTLSCNPIVCRGYPNLDLDDIVRQLIRRRDDIDSAELELNVDDKEVITKLEALNTHLNSSKSASCPKFKAKVITVMKDLWNDRTTAYYKTTQLDILVAESKRVLDGKGFALVKAFAVAAACAVVGAVLGGVAGFFLGGVTVAPGVTLGAYLGWTIGACVAAGASITAAVSAAISGPVSHRFFKPTAAITTDEEKTAFDEFQQAARIVASKP